MDSCGELLHPHIRLKEVLTIVIGQRLLDQVELYQLELELGMLDLVEDDAGYISVSGLILDKMQGNVDVGTELDYQGIQFKVTEMDGNRIKTVLIQA